MSGASAPSRSASSRPLTSGITTSVSSRSTPRALVQSARGLVGVVDGQHLVAVGLEHQPHELAHALVVLDDHDRLGAALGLGLGGGARPARRGALGGRQVDLERRAAARLAVDVDPAAALLDDAEHGREAEAGARAAALVVKNGSNRCWRTSSSMPTPVSLTASSTCGPGAPSPCAATCCLVERRRCAVSIVSAPPSRHRVAGVGGEVEDHLLELRAVGLDRREVGREPDADADVVADDPAQHRLHVGDDLVEVEHARVQHLPAAEGQQLARERRRPGAAARAISASSSRAVARRAGSRRSRAITVSRLLKSCATPPASRPIASIFSASASRCSSRWRSVTSWASTSAAWRPSNVDPPGGDLDVDQRAVLAQVAPDVRRAASPGRRAR